MPTFIGKEAGDSWETWKDYLHYVDYAVAAIVTVFGAVWLFVRSRRRRQGGGDHRRRVPAASSTAAVALGLQGPPRSASDIELRPPRARAGAARLALLIARRRAAQVVRGGPSRGHGGGLLIALRHEVAGGAARARPARLLRHALSTSAGRRRRSPSSADRGAPGSRARGGASRSRGAALCWPTGARPTATRRDRARRAGVGAGPGVCARSRRVAQRGDARRRPACCASSARGEPCLAPRGAADHRRRRGAQGCPPVAPRPASCGSFAGAAPRSPRRSQRASRRGDGPRAVLVPFAGYRIGAGRGPSRSQVEWAPMCESAYAEARASTRRRPSARWPAWWRC